MIEKEKLKKKNVSRPGQKYLETLGCKPCCGTNGCRRVKNSIYGTRKTSQKN